MKLNPTNLLGACVASMLLLLPSIGRTQVTNTYSTAGTYTWTCPNGVHSLAIQCWGGGGSGGSAQKGGSGSGGGGGGGGAYASNSISVTPGTAYTIVVGGGGTPDSTAANNAASPNGSGTNSWFGTAITTNCLAVGGGAGVDENSSAGGGGAGGAGGAAANCIGSVKFSGGTGATATASRGGGGGSSAGVAANGNNGGSGAVGNAGAAVTGGGAGGAGLTGNTSGTLGNNGGTPGGGGGGNQNDAHSSSYVGGYGAAGQVVLNYTVNYAYVDVESAPDGTGTNLTAQTIASGNSVTGYAIARETNGTFIANVAATWALTNVTGNVAGTDLVPAGNNQSAVFTAHLAGTAQIVAYFGSVTANPSGVITVPSSGTTAVWAVDANGNWTTATDWSSNPTVPGTAGDSVILGTGSALRTVTLTANESVGTISFTNPNSFVIAGASTLKLDNSGKGASLAVNAGSTNAILTPVAFNDNVSALISSGLTLTFSNSLTSTGTQTLTVGGAGTLNLQGNNTYGPAAGTVGTTIKGGTISFGQNEPLGAGDVSVNANNTLLATAGGLTLTNNLTLASGVTSTVNNGGYNLNLNGAISGGGNLALGGTGTTTLNGVNTYTGTTALNAGTLSLANATALAGGALVLNGGDLLGNGTLILNNNINIGPSSGTVGATALVDVASGQQLTLSGSIASAGNTGTDALWVNTRPGNNGTLVLSGANTFAGGLVVSNGTVNFSAANNLGAGPISLPGGTLTGTAGATTLVTVGNTISVPTNTVGTINSSPRMTFAPFGGGGTLNLNVGGTVLEYTRFESGGWSGFTGTLNITGTNVGTVAPVEGYFNGGGFDGNLGNAVVNLTNAQFSTYGNSYANTVTFGALSGDANSVLSSSDDAGYPIYAIGGLNLSTTFAGTMKNGISGAPCINKVGTGTLTLSGTSTANGWIQVNGGTLNVIGTLGNVTITNYAGTTLTGNGGTIGGTVDLKPGSTLTPSVGGFGSISIDGLTIEGGTNVFYVSTTNVSTVVMSGYPLAMISGTIQVVPTQTLPNGTYSLISYGYETGGSVANLSLVGFSQPNQVAYLQDTGSQIQLVVAARSAANLTWLGSGSAEDDIWDIATSLNWTDGTNTGLSFAPGDNVTFNDNGAGNTTVDLQAVVQPSAVTVTGNNAWVFESSTGSGSITGTNALVTSGSGSLTVEMVNSYSGGTTVGNGYTVTVGNGSDAASLGTGPITDNGSLIYNQTNSQTLAGVSGTGSLTVEGASTITLNGSYTYTGGTTIGTGATLQLGTGTNVASGPLAGGVTDNGTLTLDLTGALTVTNISGSGTFIQEGSGVITLGGSNAWQQNTYITAGTVKLASSTAIPSSATVTGSTGWLVLDGGTTAAGTLDLAGYNAAVNALSAASGTVKGLITNSSSATTTNTLVIGGTYGGLNTTYAGLINENPAGAKIALSFQGGNTNYLTQANSYSGGTTVGSGNYLYLSTATSAGTGPINLNDGAEVGCTTASLYFGNNFIIAPGSTATLYSSQLATDFDGPFTFGDANSTNILSGYISLGAATSYQFGTTTGTVVVPSGSTLRFASTGLQYNGGSNTTFDVEGSVYTRNGNFVAGEGIVMGALTGAGNLSGGGVSGSVGTTYVVGSANKSSTFTGTITDGGVGNTALIKVGTGSLTLTQPLVYSGNTTINGGALILGAGVDPTNSATISLASGTLDVASQGDGTVTLGAARNQTLSGSGTINGSLVAQANSVFSPALGTVTVTGGTVTLAGTNNFVLNRTNAANCSELVSTNLTASGVLNVVNNGPALQSGDTFQLFSQGVSGFSSVTLPTLTSPLYWSNTIASNGAITVAGTLTPPVSYIAFTGAPVISGTSLSISVTNSGGGNLYLLTTTNLANAVSTWKPIWTNNVSGSGRFTTNLLNAVNPAYSQQFFLMSTNN